MSLQDTLKGDEHSFLVFVHETLDSLNLGGLETKRTQNFCFELMNRLVKNRQVESVLLSNDICTIIQRLLIPQKGLEFSDDPIELADLVEVLPVSILHEISGLLQEFCLHFLHVLCVLLQLKTSIANSLNHLLDKALHILHLIFLQTLLQLLLEVREILLECSQVIIDLSGLLGNLDSRVFDFLCFPFQREVVLD